MIPELIRKKEEGEVVTMCTFTDNIWKDGKEVGYFELVESGDITPKFACERLNLTMAELEKKMKAAGLQFPRHNK